MQIAGGLLALLLMGLGAEAAPRQDARALALYKRADRHFSVAEVEQALPLYLEAYRLKPVARYLFAIGECQRYLGQHREALASFRRYVQALPTASNRAEVELRITALERKLAAPTSAPASIARSSSCRRSGSWPRSRASRLRRSPRSPRLRPTSRAPPRSAPPSSGPASASPLDCSPPGSPPGSSRTSGASNIAIPRRRSPSARG